MSLLSARGDHRRYPFTEGSFWIRSTPEPLPPLANRERCDVAVVGGGYTGLSAALRLKERGVDVAVLERDFCGSGASSRAAGHITPTIGKDIATCIKSFGARRGLELVRFAERAIETFEETIARYGIDCDYVRTGNIIAGVHERHRAPLISSAKAAGALGVNLRFLDEGEMRARGIPEAFRFGVLEGSGGTMDPGKYVMGLRQAALDAGVRIYESSRVTDVGRGAKVSLRTMDGVLEAPLALLATNAYTPSELGLLKGGVAPVRDTQFATRPLTESELASLCWPNREGVYTAHELLENYRLTADNRVVGGSKEVNYAYGSGLAPGYQQQTFALLERAFRERLPTLNDVPIDTFWGGWIAVTLDFLPIWGRIGPHRNIAYYTGCNGHGIPQCTMMGAAMADELLGKPSAETELLKRAHIPLPPEPLRYIVMQSILGYLAGVDRRVDRDIRAGRA